MCKKELKYIYGPVPSWRLGISLGIDPLSDREKIAVITNSSLMHMDDVIEDLLLADFVLAKLDAYSQKSLEIINSPIKRITFNMIVNSIRQFKSKYRGKLALQIMFIKENQKNAREISEIAKEINPDEVQINTPLRPCGQNHYLKKRLMK